MMKSVMILLATVGSIPASDPFTPPPAGSTDAAIMAELKAIHAEVASVNGRVDDLSKRVDALAAKQQTVPPPAGPSAAMVAWKKYSDAWDLSMKTGRPLVIWSGTAICPGCIENTTATREFSNVVLDGNSIGNGTYPPPNALTVLVPFRGQMRAAGSFTDFGTVEEGRGHIWTTREAVRKKTEELLTGTSSPTWNSAPAMMASNSMSSAAWSSSGTMMQTTGVRMMSSQPSMNRAVRMSSSGGCAS